MSSGSERARTGFAFVAWTLLPIVGATAVSALGIWAAADPANAPGVRGWALVVAVLLGPALDLMTEMALLDPSETVARRAQLEVIATHCASALVAMTPDADTRAIVFQLDAEQNAITPLARIGRYEPPRTFFPTQPDGAEVMAYLDSSNPVGELYPDTQTKYPKNYTGDRDRYRTFIRAAIYANDVVFGMVTLDAPRRKSLSKGDVRLVEFVAAELGVAFAIAAS